MSDKARVCFRVNKKTSMYTKLFKAEFSTSELDEIVDKYLHKTLRAKLKAKGIDLSISDNQKTSNGCPECKKGLLTERTGKLGKFLGCSDFPKCKFTKQLK